MSTQTLLTVAEFERLPDDGNQHELDEGELIVMPPPMLGHGRIQIRLARTLGNFVDINALGEVLTETGFRLFADTVRAPDVSFIASKNRSRLDLKHYSELAPDLAIEILSPSDVASQWNRKIRQYLKAGSHTVWVIDPEVQTVSVYNSDGSFRMLGPDDQIDAPELLPGFSVPVHSLFE